MATSLNKQYNAIDLFKFIFCIAVVAIHTDPLIGLADQPIYKIYHSFICLAVPFFFLSSGFLMYPAMAANKDSYLLGQIKKYIYVYLIWSVIYLPLAIYHYIDTGMDFTSSIIDYFIGLCFIGEHFNSWILWYILSMIFALVFIKFLKGNNISIEAITSIGFVIGIFAISITLFKKGEFKPEGVLSFIYRCFVRVGGGRVLTGLFYVPMGMLICKYQEKKKTLLLIIGIIIGFILLLISPGYGYIYEAGRVITSVGLFGIILGLKLKDNSLYLFMRHTSTITYFIHLWVVSLICAVFYKETKNICVFLLSLVICILISVVYEFYKNKKQALK